MEHQRADSCRRGASPAHHPRRRRTGTHGKRAGRLRGALGPLGLVAVVAVGLSSLLSCGGGQSAGGGGPLSVLLVTPDSLRSDRLTPFDADATAATPHLERLAREGLLFSNAWATAPWTAPSIVSLMTGRFPPVHGVVYRDDTTPSTLPSLASLLRERGAAIGNFTFFSEISYFRNLSLGPAAPGLRHDEVAGSFATWLEELDGGQPFFAWVHLLETHLPYGATGYRATEVQVPGSTGLEASQLSATVPIGSAEFAAGDRDTLLDLYDRDVEAMDDALGEVLDALDRTGRADRTLVVFVADHGEELLDGDGDLEPWVGHASTAAQARLLPETLHIPLVLRGPGVPVGERSDALVQPVSVLPTLARLLGLDDLPGLHETLPGTGSRWTELWRDRDRLAWFDSSPGGNLTPAELRGHRVQGVTDGRCLLSEEVAPGRATVSRWRSVPAAGAAAGSVGTGCDDADRRRLRRRLDDWRRQQAADRHALLEGSREAPDLTVADGWPESLEWVSPMSDALDRDQVGGQLTVDWAGGAGEAWIQYELQGGGARLLGGVDGAFLVEQRGVTFGPLPEGFWNDVAAYSPIRLRLVDVEAEQRSRWRVVEVLPVGGARDPQAQGD